MGQSNSKLTKDLEGASPEERFFGLENYGNTCYCNSVLQALYFCKPFRKRLLEYAESLDDNDDVRDTLLWALAELFAEIETQTKQVGVLTPHRFIHAVKRADERFRSYMHQDAQEFLNFLLDTLLETVTALERPPTTNGGASQASSEGSTFIHELFCGKTVSQTRCMNCENCSQREEQVMEFTLEIDRPDTTLLRCLCAYSNRELLDADNKFFCDGCNSYQEAQKWVDIKVAPPVLIFHLNRLGFMHHLGRERKLKHRVVFDQTITLPNLAAGAQGVNDEYDLFAVIAHVGAGAHHGHYVAFVLSGGKWVCFDDNLVCVVDVEVVRSTYGRASEFGLHSDMHAYVLFYQKAEAVCTESDSYSGQE